MIQKLCEWVPREPMQMQLAKTEAMSLVTTRCSLSQNSVPKFDAFKNTLAMTYLMIFWHMMGMFDDILACYGDIMIVSNYPLF